MGRFLNPNQLEYLVTPRRTCLCLRYKMFPREEPWMRRCASLSQTRLH